MLTKEAHEVHVKYLSLGQIFIFIKTGESFSINIDYQEIKHFLESSMPTQKWYLATLQYLGFAFNNITDEDLNKIHDSVMKILLIFNQLIQENEIEIYNLDRHATYLRLKNLCIVYEEIKENFIYEMIKNHADFISGLDDRDFGWNHGLDADRALLMASYIIENDAYKNMALESLIKNIEASVDEYGVTREQAVSYQKYARDVLSEIKIFLAGHNETKLNDVLKGLI